MELTEKKVADTLIVSISGRLETSSTLIVDKKINQRIDEGERRIVINLSKLEYMSSSGLRLFLGIGKRLKQEGGAFALSGVPDHQLELIEITHLDQVVSIFASDGDAIIGISKEK
ncbi:MAG: anti-sigma factor antagonist [Candidatus Omnitrophota bacterium]|jgi:anti-anti-sigma factor|nr:MAG: anti-sigma factor antagonist [Candidatus Omnitrophota bacterium]